MAKWIKVYGERNTGTNYVSKLIRLNLDVKELPGSVPQPLRAFLMRLPFDEVTRDLYFRLTYSENLGWKHTRVKYAEDLELFRQFNSGVSFLTITKNPYSWLLSLHCRPYHQRFADMPSFEEFLRRPWKTTGRDGLGVAQLPSPIELWNLKNRSYLRLPEARVLSATFEATLCDPRELVDRISRKFDIARLSKEFRNYNQSTKDTDKDGDYYRDYYLNERWRTKLSDEAIATINATVDRELMHHFGYEPLN